MTKIKTIMFVDMLSYPLPFPGECICSICFWIQKRCYIAI